MASWSPYNYTFNNPIKFTDPTGLAPEIDTNCGCPPDCPESIADYIWDKVKSIFTPPTVFSTEEEINRSQETRQQVSDFVKQGKENLKEKTSISVEAKARVSYGPQFALGVDGAKVEGGAISQQLFEINPKLEWNFNEGLDVGLNLNTDNKIIHRVGGSYIVGARAERTDAFLSSGQETTTSVTGNLLFLQQRHTYQGDNYSQRTGLNFGGSFGGFLVIDYSSGLYINMED